MLKTWHFVCESANLRQSARIFPRMISVNSRGLADKNYKCDYPKDFSCLRSWCCGRHWRICRYRRVCCRRRVGICGRGYRCIRRRRNRRIGWQFRHRCSPGDRHNDDGGIRRLRRPRGCVKNDRRLRFFALVRRSPRWDERRPRECWGGSRRRCFSRGGCEGLRGR